MAIRPHTKIHLLSYPYLALGSISKWIVQDSPGHFLHRSYIILHDQQVLQSGVQNLQMQDRLAHWESCIRDFLGIKNLVFGVLLHRKIFDPKNLQIWDVAAVYSSLLQS